MTKSFLALLAVSAAVLGLSACTPEQRAMNMAPGSYKTTQTSVDEHGTKVIQKNETDVDVDAYGNKRAVVESKTTEDPRGLLNKRTISKSRTVQEYPSPY
jgi:hypothetical protein